MARHRILIINTAKKLSFSRLTIIFIENNLESKIRELKELVKEVTMI